MKWPRVKRRGIIPNSFRKGKPYSLKEERKEETWVLKPFRKIRIGFKFRFQL